MVEKKAHAANGRKILFARVGWMHFYNGPVPGDERPVGGGAYTKTNLGHEVYNFRVTQQRLYGYFQPPMSSDAVALQRIDPKATWETQELQDVLLIYVARHPAGGHVIVGWYNHAALMRNRVKQSPGKPRKFGYFAYAQKQDCILLPSENRRFEIPSGKGGMGRSNVCYPLTQGQEAKQSKWMQDAVDFIDHYQGINILDNPEADAEKESAAAAEKALARSKGQGFARTLGERQAIEDHAMAAAKKYFRNNGYDVSDVSDRFPYDLLCIKADREVHVEVKGTTTDGEVVVLTYNEVKHANNADNNCILFILHSIKLKGSKTSGGTRLLLDPWQVRDTHLRPISYTYRIPEM